MYSVLSDKTIAYPERVLIYNAGTGKAVFIGCLKLTTIFLFSFSCLIVAPAFYRAPDYPNWAPAAGQSYIFYLQLAGQFCGCQFRTNEIIAVLGGAIPLLFVASTTAPLVFYIHLRPPLFARRSREALMRYSKNIPADARIDLTTMKVSSRQRVTGMRVSELKPMKAWLSVANLVRNPPSSTTVSSRAWWMSKPPRQFYVGTERGRSREKGVWDNILNYIKQRS